MYNPFRYLLKDNILKPPFLTRNICRYVAQTYSGCGHACLAMILNKRLDEINKSVGYDTCLDKGDLINILRCNGFPEADVEDFIPFKPLPGYCLIIAQQRYDKKVWHCLIKDGEKVIDPDHEGVHDLIWLAKQPHKIKEYVGLKHELEF